MAPAALLFTIVFVADAGDGRDDPDRVRAVVVEVVDDAAGRRADVVVVRAGGASVTASFTGPAADGSRRLRPWPLPPPGVSFTPAVDGLVVSVDDPGGPWQPPPAPPAATKTKRTTTTTATSATASLPVASDRALRLLLPTIVDERPVAAALYGSATRLTGQAVVVQRAVPLLALSLSGSEADGGAALIAAEAAAAVAGCAPAPSIVVQPLTRLTSTTVSCVGALAVSPAVGTRFADRADKDRAAVGVVVRHFK